MSNIARNDLAVSVRQPALYVMFLAIPIVVISYLVPTVGALLRARGYASANGSELVVPGMTVMFGFFVLTLAGHSVLTEYQDETWARLRALPARPMDILVGKTITPLTMALAQQVLLFAGGVFIFDMEIKGPKIALVVIGASFAILVAGLSIAVIAVARTFQQVSLFANVSMLVLGGLGSAFAPPELMPGWARAIAPYTPGYWTIDAYRGVILDGKGVGDVLGQIGVILGWATVAVVVGIARYRNDARQGRLP